MHPRLLIALTLLLAVPNTGCITGGPLSASAADADADALAVDVTYLLAADGTGRSAVIDVAPGTLVRLEVPRLPVNDSSFWMDGNFSELPDGCLVAVWPDGEDPMDAGAFFYRPLAPVNLIDLSSHVTAFPADGGRVRVAWSCEPGTAPRVHVGQGSREMPLAGTAGATRQELVPVAREATGAEPLARAESLRADAVLTDVTALGIVITAEHTRDSASAGIAPRSDLSIHGEGGSATPLPSPYVVTRFTPMGWSWSIGIYFGIPLSPGDRLVFEEDSVTAGPQDVLVSLQSAVIPLPRP